MRTSIIPRQNYWSSSLSGRGNERSSSLRWPRGRETTPLPAKESETCRFSSAVWNLDHRSLTNQSTELQQLSTSSLRQLLTPTTASRIKTCFRFIEQLLQPLLSSTGKSLQPRQPCTINIKQIYMQRRQPPRQPRLHRQRFMSPRQDINKSPQSRPLPRRTTVGTCLLLRPQLRLIPCLPTCSPPPQLLPPHSFPLRQHMAMLP